MRLVEFGGGRIVSGGQLMFNRKAEEPIDLAQGRQRDMRDMRGNEIGMIFQEPMTALNPVFTVGRQLTDGPDQAQGHVELRRRAPGRWN
jgi:ABC-type dipeptide/oligopeptide/nickel transport system ATPase component